MALIVNPKNKQQEKIIKAFLTTLEIGFHTEAEEDEALHKAMKAGRKTRLLNETEKEQFLTRLKNAK
jgi:hypothetical protein